MNKRPFVILGILAAICVIAIPAYVLLFSAGSGDAAVSGVADRDEEARELFATNCGACHTLAAAGTDGVVGPNLDDLLVPTPPADPSALADSYEGNATRVLQAVQCGLGGRMPKGILVGEQSREVAEFVGAYAGQLSPGAGPSVDTDEAPELDDATCSSGDPSATPADTSQVDDGA